MMRSMRSYSSPDASEKMCTVPSSPPSSASTVPRSVPRLAPFLTPPAAPPAAPPATAWVRLAGGAPPPSTGATSRIVRGRCTPR
eukprot:scaffold8942_cov57-Phaeocystis_antarctica.AAC.2